MKSLPDTPTPPEPDTLEAPKPRLVVCINGICVMTPCVEEAAALAQLMDTSLEGILLENPHLREVSQISFTTEVGLVSARPRNLSPASLSRSFRRLTEDTRRTFDRLTLEHGIAAKLLVQPNLGKALSDVENPNSPSLPGDASLLLISNPNSPSLDQRKNGTAVIVLDDSRRALELLPTALGITHWIGVKSHHLIVHSTDLQKALRQRNRLQAALNNIPRKLDSYQITTTSRDEFIESTTNDWDKAFLIELGHEGIIAHETVQEFVTEMGVPVLMIR